MENVGGKWTSGTGPRIACVRDYPTELQFRALEQINCLEKPESEIISREPQDSCIDLSSISEHNAAATTIQRIYRSYRTRRNLADSAVVVEKLWWQALDFAALDLSSVSLLDAEKPNTAISRWATAQTRAAKVGKGLTKSEKAQKLALQHWLEAIDPRHRYGHNLHIYYDLWFESASTQPFFYWLDIGEGKDYDPEKCPRSKLQRQCIKYLGPNERESYEVIFENGKLIYRQSGLLLETTKDSKWIFVLSTSKNLYVGKKQKGLFMHSSFLAGGAIMAAGRLVSHGGVLQALWPYSGHYLPTEENFREFISFLEENHVDLTNVKKMSVGMELESYELIVENGKLVYRQSGLLLETTEDSNWFFVLSTSKKLYVGKNEKEVYGESGYLAGGATMAAGRLVAHGGILEAIWPYSGHVDLPTEENYMEFMSFLVKNHVDLTNVKIRMTFRALLICTSKLL